MSACVSGPGSYFETVGREKRGVQSTQADTQVAGLSIGAVESNTLAPVQSAETTQPAPAPSDTTQPATNEAQAALLPPESQGTIDANTGDNVALQPVEQPLQLGMVQNDTGEILITPTPAYPDPANPSERALAIGNSATVASANSSSTAYIDPSAGQSLPGVSEQLMASTNPVAPLPGAVNENGFAIGTESAPQTNALGNPLGNPLGEPLIDPEEYAAEQRIPILFSQIEHGQCSRGFGPKPKKMSATNMNPGDPYYIEIRMRKTPLLPVGHTYVAYGRLDPFGEILDEKLIMLAPVGGYAGAALASGIPMPGVLTPHRDDCRIRPETAYRVSLSAQRYEKLLLEIQKAKQQKPSYLLFANNCNHFMTRIAQSVGLKPPKNIYVPALEYIYAMIENNEGRKISRR